MPFDPAFNYGLSAPHGAGSPRVGDCGCKECTSGAKCKCGKHKATAVGDATQPASAQAARQFYADSAFLNWAVMGTWPSQGARDRARAAAARKAAGPARIVSPVPVGWSRATIGEDPLRDPPHEGDWWVTTNDALDYANWLDRRIDEFNGALGMWLVSPGLMADQSLAGVQKHAAAVAAASKWIRDSGWSLWREEWLAYVKHLRDNWASWVNVLGGPVLGAIYDPRVNSWYKIRDRWHREFLEFARSSKQKGGPDSDARLPVDPLDQPGLGLGLPTGEQWRGAADAAAGVGWGLGIAAAGVAALLFARSARK